MRPATISLEPRVRHAVAGRIDVRRHVVGVDAHDVAQCAVALERKVFLVVINVKDGLRRVHHAPHDRDADLHGVAETVVDLLAGVVERHDLERDLLIPGDFDRAARLSGSDHDAVLGAVHIAALAELCVRRGVDRRAERIHVIKALALERADILTEERENERFLRLEDTQTAKRDPAERNVQNAENNEENMAAHRAENDGEDRGGKQRQIPKQHRHAVLPAGNDLFLHDTSLH